MSTKMRIAVIGAGLAGLIVARELSDVADVVVFEKARGVGGRMATRYAESYQFDLGAQFFLAKDEDFRAFLEPLEKEGVIARWDPDFVEFTGTKITHQRQWNTDFPHYVGAPKMNSACKYLAQSTDVVLKTRIEHIKYQHDQWLLIDDMGNQQGTFDWVISTAPAQQTVALLPQIFTHMDRLQQTKMLGCFTLMLGFEQPLALPWQAALVKERDISWISVNSDKPGRSEHFTMVAHATNTWAEAHMEDDMQVVAEHLLSEVSALTAHDVRQAAHIDVHRWRYANIGKQGGDLALVDAQHQLAACGDWCIQGRVECAFASAMDLVRQLKSNLLVTSSETLV